MVRDGLYGLFAKPFVSNDEMANVNSYVVFRSVDIDWVMLLPK